MIPNALAMGLVVSLAAISAAHLSVRAYLVVLGAFALVWIFASEALTNNDPGGLALVVLLFLLAAGLAVAAWVQLVRMFFRDRAMNRKQITLAAALGSVVATGFLYLLFAG